MFKKTYIEPLGNLLALALSRWTPELCPLDHAQDPLSHPAIRAMSSTELADLPFEPYVIAEPAGMRRRGNAANRAGTPAIRASACITAPSPL